MTEGTDLTSGQPPIQDYHWIARNLATFERKINSYDVLNADTILEMAKFFVQHRIKPFESEKSPDNWVDVRAQLFIDPWKEEYELPWSEYKGKPLMFRPKEEINRILVNPIVSGEIRAGFNDSLPHIIESLPDWVRAEYYGQAPTDREPFEDLSEIFYTKWCTGGNSGFVVSTSGQNGSAKTGWLMLEGEMALRRFPEMRMPTNVVTRKTTSEMIKKRIQPFSTIGEWVRLLLINKIEGMRSHSAIDELTNSSIRRKTTMHSTTLSFDRMDKNTRKLDDDNDYAWHFRSEVPKEVELKSVFKVIKHGSTLTPQQRHIAEIDYEYGHGWRRKYLSGVPQPSIEYVSDAWAFFILDIDIEQVWLDFAKIQKAEDDQIEATHKRLEIVEAAIEENQSSELEEEVYLPIKEASERAGLSMQELKHSKYFVLQDRKAAGWFVKPAEGFDWKLNRIEEAMEA